MKEEGRRAHGLGRKQDFSVPVWLPALSWEGIGVAVPGTETEPLGKGLLLQAWKGWEGVWLWTVPGAERAVENRTGAQQGLPLFQRRKMGVLKPQRGSGESPPGAGTIGARPPPPPQWEE